MRCKGSKICPVEQKILVIILVILQNLLRMASTHKKVPDEVQGSKTADDAVELVKEIENNLKLDFT